MSTKGPMNVNKLSVTAIFAVVVFCFSPMAQAGSNRSLNSGAVPCDGEAAAIAAGAIRKLDLSCPPPVQPAASTQTWQAPPPPPCPPLPQPGVILMRKPSLCERLFGGLFRATVVIDGGFAPRYYRDVYWADGSGDHYFIGETRYLYTGRYQYHQNYIPPYRSGPFPPPRFIPDAPRRGPAPQRQPPPQRPPPRRQH
jgi:hypothetical protein